MSEPDYFAIRRFRKEVPDRFLGYPVTSDRDDVICSAVMSQSRRVLEIGAGDRPFEGDLRARGFRGTFKTMDVDRKAKFDFYSIDEINESFDAVIMREVVEHLPRPVLYRYLDRICEILETHGTLVITTPNPWAGGWMFADYTHISPWPPADLYGLLRWHGFNPVEIQRVVWPSRALWLKKAYWAVHSRFYDVDFAGSYVAVATRSSVQT